MVQKYKTHQNDIPLEAGKAVAIPECCLGVKARPLHEPGVLEAPVVCGYARYQPDAGKHQLLCTGAHECESDASLLAKGLVCGENHAHRHTRRPPNNPLDLPDILSLSAV